MSAPTMHVVTLTSDQLAVLRLLVRAEVARTCQLRDKATTLANLDLFTEQERNMRALSAVLVLA